MEERLMRSLVPVILLIIFSVDVIFAQRSKKNTNIGNVGQYGLVSFSRPFKKDSIKVTTFIEIPFSSLQFIKRNSDFIASYSATVMLTEINEKLLIKKVWSDSIVVSEYIHTQSKLRTKKHFINFNVSKGKYNITSELYDNDTRKKGSKKKNINFTKQNKMPSLMEPIIITNLKGDWGFNSNQFPILGKKITNIDNGLNILVSGFVDDSPYSIQTKILLGNEKTTLPLIENQTTNGFFVHMLKLEKEYLQSFNTKIIIELKQSSKVKKIEKNITIFKPGISGYVKNIDNSFRQMKYILTSSERKNAKGKKGKDLENIFLQYWDKRDPTPETNLNELMEEYYIRVNYVNEYFNMSWKEGWETDFGMIYILFGPPDEIQRSNVNSSNTTTYQVWYYNRINKQFVFKDQNGFGDYRLDRPFIGSSY
tara:strand:- start:10074 stop:11342 length:1269 start_codon:yes stop_codon:yes gene_type:complete